MNQRVLGGINSEGPAAGRSGWRIVVVMLLAVSAASLAGMFAMAEGSSAQSSEAPQFLLNEEPAPTTANKECEPSREHPYPVVLVHGTFENAKQNWEAFSGELTAKGYCVFALNYGGKDNTEPVQNGLGPIQNSARELDTFVNRVLEFTGAKKVQLLGHSQGGMMPRYWIKFYGGAPLVEDLVGFAPSNYGTNLSDDGGETDAPDTPEEFDLPSSDSGSAPCKACDQQGAGSKFLKRLNSGDDTLGSGSYTQIATKNDEIIIPFTNCFLKGEERTTNVTLQDFEPYENIVVTHQNIYQDPYAKALAFDALDNPGPANPKRAQKSLTDLL